MKRVMKIVELTEVLSKSTKSGKPYVRVSLLLEDENELILKAKVNLSDYRFMELKNVLNVGWSVEQQKLLTLSPKIIEFDDEEKTNTQKPKLIFEKIVGVYNGFRFEYYELNVFILIKNKLVSPSNVKE